MVRKRYYYIDGMLRHWVRLHARGRLATAAEIEATARAVLAPAPSSGAASAAPPARVESLMEID